MDNFYYRDGLVGRYQGYNVYVIDEEDYNEERDDII